MYLYINVYVTSGKEMKIKNINIVITHLASVPSLHSNQKYAYNTHKTTLQTKIPIKDRKRTCERPISR